MTPPTPQPLKDFADWISPMLVKELRQGMRTRVFVVTFIALQVLMTINVVISLLAASGGAEASVLAFFFWAMIAIPLTLVLPFTALGALSSEMKGDTLELVLLTRLSAWRIAWGKWFAVVAQAGLFVCAILPYVVLRYFMGGVNIADDLRSIVLLFVAAAVLSAVMIGISPFQSKIARILLGIGALFGLQIVPGLVFGMTAGGRAVGMAMEWKTWGIFAPIYFALLILLMLQIGAGRIAPPSENHSATKRLIGLGFLLLATVARWVLPYSETVIIFCLLACVPVLTGAICEPLQSNPSIYRPFARRGVIGRFAGRLFYAGWPAGLPYVALLLFGFAILMACQGLLDDEKQKLGMTAFAGTFLFGAVLLRLCFPRTRNALGIFIATVGLGIFLAGMVAVLDKSLDWGVISFFSVLPPCALAFNFVDLMNAEEIKAARHAVTFSSGVCLLLALFLTLRSWKKIRAFEDASLNSDEMA